jgi:hypothetical protein
MKLENKANNYSGAQIYVWYCTDKFTYPIIIWRRGHGQYNFLQSYVYAI